MTEKVSWGIISTGRIAGVFAQGVKESRTGRLAAVGSRDQASADLFGDEHGIQNRHGSYEALLADPTVQAVYIATPHPQHAEWAIKAADAGKHILCEKPLTMNAREAKAVVDAVRRNGVFLMEAYMYRCHPQTAELMQLILMGVIGEVRLIQAFFGFNAKLDLKSRLFDPMLGGGGILDVGGYCTSMVRLIAGAANGAPFAEPLRMDGIAQIGRKSHVDEYAVAVMSFPGDILAQISTGVRVNQDNTVRIDGSKGSIVVPAPWMCTPTDGVLKIVLHLHDAKPHDIVMESDRSLYAYEADAFAAGIRDGKAPWPAMSIEDSLGNMATLDRWREAVGMKYPFE